MTDDIMELATRWLAAQRRGDARALDDMLTEDFTAVEPDGVVLGRAEWLERYASGDLAHTALACRDVRVTPIGTHAAAVGVRHEESTYRGRPSRGTFRVVQLFINRTGRWLLQGVHTSPLAELPAPAGR